VAFDDDIALTPGDDGAFSGRIADGWTTPRGPHGGYVMAMVLHAMELAIGDPQRQPRSLTVHFLRPPKLGPVTARPIVERAGRALSTVTARLEQDGKPVARFTTKLARDGFFEEDGELWATDGTLVAQSRQLGLLLQPIT
jgi:acyl-CoA thioesterase